MNKICNKVKTVLAALLISSFAFAQESTFPVNGVANKNNLNYVFTNATIYTDYQTKIVNATLIIKNGVVEQAGAGIAIPKGSVVYDLKGKTIYPSFIDPYTNYGIADAKPVSAAEPQIETATKGAYNWNQAVKPEFDAAKVFLRDEKSAEEFRKLGFGAVCSFQKDGIVRGTSVIVNLSDEKENNLIIQENASANYSFDKGVSQQEYPSSLMGSIALLRQTYYDAIWYKSLNSIKKEKNISLDAFNKNQTIPQVFDVKNKFNVLRADKIGDEFKMQYIFKGAGDEYQRISEIKATNGSFILPLNFPTTLDVESPYDALNASLDEMKHWESAPFNLAAFEKNKINFAVTTSDLKEKKDFWTNLRKAIESGLSETEALKSITYSPAAMYNVQTKIGSLKTGMYANFIITSGNVFDKKTIIHENWIKGKRFIINDYKQIDARANYTLSFNNKNYELKINGETESPKATLMVDTNKVKTTFSISNTLVSLTFDMKDEGTYRFAGSIAMNEKGEPNMLGTMQDAEGQSYSWTAIYKSVMDAEKKKDKDSAKVTPEMPELIYPFTAYGQKESLKKETILIKNATVWTNESDGILKNTDVLISNGKIEKVGKGLTALAGARLIDGTNKHVTSGVIDEHSHIAITNGVNEGAQSVTAEVRIGDVLNPEDINIYRQLSGGVTAAQLLHGSANPIGGQSALIKLRWGVTPEQLKIEGADGFIKCALGENVKQSNWGDNARVRFPQTRMGVEQVFVDAFTRAKEYEQKLKLATPANPVRKDLELDAVLEILNKKRFITCHSYVQSEINMLMHVADTFGFKINTFTHILEGYKVADKMKAHGVAGSTFSDWWAYKMEVQDAIPYNGAIMHKMGIVTAFNSDDAEMARRLNQEAAKAVKYGNVSEEDAWKFVTLNPAKMLHLDSKMGSLKSGKDADVVVWSDNPLSIYAKAEQTIVDGIVYFDQDKDKQLRMQIQTERNRLIQKMIKAKSGGEPTVKPAAKKQKLYHCDSLEENEELHNY